MLTISLVRPPPVKTPCFHGARYTAKLSINDNERVAAAIDHYEPHIDFDKLLE